MKPVQVFAALAFACSPPANAGPLDSILNPTGREYRSHLVRLAARPPKGDFVVTRGGAEIPHQIESIGDRKWVWICDDFAPRSSNSYEVAVGRGQGANGKGKRVQVEKGRKHWTLDNGLVGVRVPTSDVGQVRPVGPVRQVRLPNGKWVGRSTWNTGLKPKKFSSELIGDGTLFAKVRLRYEFDGVAGLEGETPAFSEIDITLAPAHRHVVITERHEMLRGSYWEFDASEGWKPREGKSVWYRSGPGGPAPGIPEQNRSLEAGALPLHDPELYIILLARWDQSFRDGWFFAATDGEQAIGGMAVKAGRWRWPHENGVRVRVKESGEYVGFRCPTRRGSRYWWLTAGDTNAPVGKPSVEYIKEHGFEDLDKLNHEFILTWPGKKQQWWSMFPYKDWDINPTSGIRRFGRNAMKNAGKPGGIAAMIEAQYRLHPDTYGSYWDRWSPENPNFFSDFIKLPFAKITNLKGHPRFKEFCGLAEMKLREDIYHSITMPGGAGQECPGYMAIRHMMHMAEVGKEHLGFDLTKWDRLLAGFAFQRRISQPNGGQRIFLPMGDTHPGGNGPRPIEVNSEEVKRFTTEELPGFGVVFNGKPGTPKETYLAFKAGPNRGHYHGDQLSFHYCANAKPTAVDHHCSYSPRAGQEHMHNRVAFWKEGYPYMNMGGFERLIAFKASDDVDIAIGQVESEYLRSVHSMPPTDWHNEWPLHRFDGKLTYRRTIVFVKNGREDYFVIRDQYDAPEELGAAFCLHVDARDTVAFESPPEQGGLSKGKNVWVDKSQDFGKLGVKPGWALHTGKVKKGGRHAKWIRQKHYDVVEVKKHELVVDRNIPETENFAYILYRPKYRADDATVVFDRMTLFRAHPAEAKLRFLPWYFAKAGSQATSGIRLETKGKAGEFVTVIYPGTRAPEMESIPGGVRVGDDEIVFGGGIAEEPGTTYVSVKRGGKEKQSLTGKDIDLNRFQGDVGLCVLNVGQNFGDIPAWLIRQRSKKPKWYRECWMDAR